jgi:hypothetical protein
MLGISGKSEEREENNQRPFSIGEKKEKLLHSLISGHQNENKADYQERLINH